ncbi:SLAP domain-containing protein [Gracilibacillus halotolerans]|uniref:SLAP domain-containing protein n=1 Tax=Gracilibacillus halotolerans TaxID=74386 RepID=A0A841RNV8_9BACI|nr:SLAP domain-containing protein [Gracilibacillus halotolerans]MBB6513562.1 SLAP domain-containing protein [Gracilibacillus halotolerans]
MQSFQLQEAWQRQISPDDKEQLIDLFNKTRNQMGETITCIPYRLAFNHRQDLLCTVLIHNTKDESIDLRNVMITIKKESKEVATNIFEDLPLQLPSKTSMPWTYIFPLNHYDTSLTIDDTNSIAVSLSEHTKNNNSF